MMTPGGNWDGEHLCVKEDGVDPKRSLEVLEDQSPALDSAESAALFGREVRLYRRGSFGCLSPVQVRLEIG